MSGLVDLIGSSGFGVVALLILACAWLTYGLAAGGAPWLDGSYGDRDDRDAGRGPYETTDFRPDEHRGAGKESR